MKGYNVLYDSVRRTARGGVESLIRLYGTINFLQYHYIYESPNQPPPGP